MNIEVKPFFPQKVLKEIFPLISSFGSSALEMSRHLDKFDASLREVFGLCIISSFRSFIEPDKTWLSLINRELSDDGSILSINNESNQVNYYENIEQIYIPGNFIKRGSDQNINDCIFDLVLKKKNRGFEYQRDKSLLILNDIKSLNRDDCFGWKDFVKKFFADDTFMHLYFLSLLSPHFDYYLLSFTNQKHRQFLNGEFRFKIRNGDISDFECVQSLNLLKK